MSFYCLKETFQVDIAIQKTNKNNFLTSKLKKNNKKQCYNIVVQIFENIKKIKKIILLLSY